MFYSRISAAHYDRENDLSAAAYNRSFKVGTKYASCRLLRRLKTDQNENDDRKYRRGVYYNKDFTE